VSDVRGPSEIAEAAEWLRERIGEPPQIAIVLGSGLGAFAARLDDAVMLDGAEVPHWPRATVIGHAGRVIAGRVAGRRLLVLSGRVHFYEGHAMAAVTFPVRVLATLGVTMLVLTNAAGGIQPRFRPGTVMVIDDHLSLFVPNPLVGPNDERVGPRFPDMTHVYSPRLRAIARDAARDAAVPLAHGVYAAVTGPSYETPADIRALRALGADAVGMSTVPEAIVARHLGLEVLGLSCIANAAAGMRPTPLSATEVLETMRRTEQVFVTLLEAIVARV
jgi:purine-nucleoside phosphorylase